MSDQVELAKRTNAETEVAQEDQEETKGALLGFVFERARGDDSLSSSQTQIIGAAEVNSHLRTTSGALLGKRLAELGDEIDSQYHDEMEEIVQMSGTPQEALSSFNDVVKNLFQWDEHGMAKINIGRIAALLAYCYHLIKTYIRSKIGVSDLVTFLGLVTGWLVKFLFKAKFYEWLQQQGGWGQLILSPVSAWLNSVGKHAFLVIGVASLLVWGYAVFRK